MDNPVIIFGAGTLGKVALDIFNENNVLIYGFLDDNPELLNKEIGSAAVIGKTDEQSILDLLGEKTEAFLAIRNKEDRKRIASDLLEKAKVMPINAIHKRAIFSEESQIGHGNLIGANSVIGAFAKIGKLNIIGSAVVIDAEVQIGDFTDIGNGSTINSECIIGDGVFIGSNVTIVSGIKIGSNARIGAGSVIIENIEEGATVFGNPAKAVS